MNLTRKKIRYLYKLNLLNPKIKLVWISIFIISFVLASFVVGLWFSKANTNTKTYNQGFVAPVSTFNPVKYEETTPTQEPSVILADSLPESSSIAGWKDYQNDRFSIEIPKNWNILDYSNQKTYFGDIPPVRLVVSDNIDGVRYPTRAYGDPSLNVIRINLGEMYRNEKWSELASKDTFFDLQSNIWTDTMLRSYGGGFLKTKIQINQIGNLKVVKHLNTWTEVMEGVDSTDTSYFFPDSSASNQLLVWDINYRLPIKGSDVAEREKLIKEIISSFKLAN